MVIFSHLSGLNHNKIFQVAAYSVFNMVAVFAYGVLIYMAMVKKQQEATELNQLLLEDVCDEDREKFTACKILFCWQLSIVALVSILVFQKPLKWPKISRNEI